MEIYNMTRVSEIYSKLQNDVADAFKKLVIVIYKNKGMAGGTLNAFQRMLEQFKGNPLNDVQDIYEHVESITSGQVEIYEESLYLDYMVSEVYSEEYNTYDEHFHDLGSTYYFETFYDAFLTLISKAIEQFCTGRNLVDKINKQVSIISITEQYRMDDIKLTLRQLYYQLVSYNIIDNKNSEYNKIIDLTGNMRENCVLRMDEFADNTRFAITYDYEVSPADYLMDKVSSRKYFRNSREGQSHYLEVWIEKEALRSVFKPVTDELDVPLFICRGYPSTSSLYEQAKRIIEKSLGDSNIDKITILYFGDHDPSGLQIPESIELILRRDYLMEHVRVVQCGLTKHQIETNNLPPNPAKTTDPRAKRYFEEHGYESWELDAIPPKVLQSIVRSHIGSRTDFPTKQDVLSMQQQDRSKIDRVREFIRENWINI